MTGIEEGSVVDNTVITDVNVSVCHVVSVVSWVVAVGYLKEEKLLTKKGVWLAN